MHREKSHPNRAYLLRCWREGEAAPGKEPLWRFSVEEILPFDPSAGLRRAQTSTSSVESSSRSGQRKLRALHEQRRKGFSTLGALLAFLRAELASGEEEPSDDAM